MAATCIKNQSIVQTAFYNLKAAAERLGIEDSMFARLSEHRERIEVTLNPAMPDGKIVHVRAFVVDFIINFGNFSITQCKL